MNFSLLFFTFLYFYVRIRRVLNPHRRYVYEYESEYVGDGYSDGDIITVNLDGMRKSMQILVNDKEECHFADISQLRRYYLVISLKNDGDSVSVVESNEMMSVAKENEYQILQYYKNDRLYAGIKFS